MLQLAAHLERPERARALYLLSLALGDSEQVEEDRLDQLDELVLALLERSTSPASRPATWSSVVVPRRSVPVREIRG